MSAKRRLTASFEQAVRRAMAHHPEAESCAADRLAGVVAGRIICGATESVIVIDARVCRALRRLCSMSGTTQVFSKGLDAFEGLQPS